MGGGHLSRPDFGMPQPDPAHPLTEFYLLLQHGLDREGVFALPALWADFQAPARRIYADEAEAFLTLRETPGAASTPLLAPRTLQLLYSSLHVLPDGTPAALLLTEECTRTVYAVQLLPPFVWEDPLPPLPDCAAARSPSRCGMWRPSTPTLMRWSSGSAGSRAASTGLPTPRPKPSSPGALRCFSDCTNVEFLLYSFYSAMQ